MKSIGFFLSAQDIDQKYVKPALKVVELTVKQGWDFVYGGSDKGLMKQAADTAQKFDGKIIGISSIHFPRILRKKMDETYVAKTLAERKKIIIDKSDAIVILPGGAGTFDEVTDLIEHKKIKTHNKPIVILNTDGFWDGMIGQYQRMYREGFINVKPEKLFFVSKSPKEIISFLKKEI